MAGHDDGRDDAGASSADETRVARRRVRAPVRGRPRSGRFRPTLDAGEVIGSAFAAWKAGAPLYLLITAAANAPMLLNEIVFAGSPEFMGVQSIIDFVAILVLVPFAQGAVICGVHGQLSGQPLPIGVCLQRALMRLGAIVVANLLFGFLILLGLLALLVGALWVQTACYGVLAVAVIEGKAGSALARAASLTSGNRGNILLVVILFNVITIVAGWSPDILVNIGVIDYTGIPYLSIALSAAAGSLSAAGHCATYHTLIRLREGAGDSELAKVFE